MPFEIPRSLNPPLSEKYTAAPRCVEHVDELIEHGVEQRRKVLGPDGGHDDRERTRKALVGASELGEHALHLAVVEILLLDVSDRDEDAFVPRPQALGGLYGTGPDLDGNERAVAQLEHKLAFGPVGRERQTMSSRALERT